MADAPLPTVPMPDQQIPVFNPDGQFGYLPASEWDAGAQLQGYRLATPQEVSHVQAEAQYGAPGAAVTAAGAAAARALTLGLSDQALTKTGLVAPETLRGLEEANPVASGIGTVAGIAAPLLLTGGAAAPAEAGVVAGGGGALEAGAALTAPSLIAKAGQAVTRATAEALPEASGLLGRVVNRAIATGAGSAVEGAAYGLGQVVSEDALGAPGLTAESALATVGLSAALGGGLGAAIGVAHEAIPAAVLKTRDAIGSAFGKVKGSVEDWYQGAEGVHGVNPATAQLILEHKLEVSALEQQAPGITATLTQSKPTVAASILENASQFGALEREFPGIGKTLSKTRPDTLSLILAEPEKYANLEREFPGTLRQLSAAEPGTAQYLADNWQLIVRDPVERAKLSEAVRKSGQQIIDSTDAMFTRAYGQMMKDGAPELLADANPQAIMEAYSGLWAKTADAIGEMEARPSLFDPYYPAKLRTLLEDLVKDSPKATDPTTAFRHLTRLRQEIGDMISWGKSGLLPPAERDAQQLVKGIYRDVSAALRSEETFGAAGARKAELDEAFAAWKRLTERRPGAMLGKSEKGTTNFNFLLMQSGALSPNKMNAWFKHLADDTGALKTEAWSHMMDAARRSADAVEALHQAAPATTTFDRAAITDLIGKTQTLTEDAAAKFRATQVLDQLNPKFARAMHEALAAAPAGQAATETLTAAQHAAGYLGPISSTVKAVLSPITQTVETARSFPKGVAVLASLERMGQRISNAIDTAAGTIVRGSPRAETIGRAEVEAGIAREFGSSAEQSLARFNRRVSDIQSLSADPSALHKAIVQQNQGLDEHAPKTSQALAVTSTRAINFLASKVPQHPVRGPLAPKWEPSQAEVAKFARYYEAVQNPLVVLKQAAAGTLTPEAIEAVQAVYPDLFARMQAGIVSRLASGNRPPARSRLMLSLLLGQDMDGSLGMLMANQAIHQGPSAKQQGPGAAPPAIKPNSRGMGRVSISERSLTPLQASANRRA